MGVDGPGLPIPPFLLQELGRDIFRVVVLSTHAAEEVHAGGDGDDEDNNRDGNSYESGVVAATSITLAAVDQTA